MYFPYSSAVRLLSRPKLIGVGSHVGVQLGDGSVVHVTPSGVEQTSLPGFALGLPVTEKRRAPPHTWQAVEARAYQALRQGWAYRLEDQNCEHFATWVLDGKPESEQVDAVAAIALAVAVGGLFAGA